MLRGPGSMPASRAFHLAGGAHRTGPKLARSSGVYRGTTGRKSAGLGDALTFTRRFECLAAGEAHQRGQARAGLAMGGDSVRLQVMLHLQTMFDVA